MVAKTCISAWIILPETHILSPIDAFAFRNIVLICMSVGLISCIGYQAILKIPCSQVINQLPTIDSLQPSKCKLIRISVNSCFWAWTAHHIVLQILNLRMSRTFYQSDSVFFVYLLEFSSSKDSWKFGFQPAIPKLWIRNFLTISFSKIPSWKK